MPYQSTSQLPKGVKNNLPKHAQEIYKAAFNSAWDSYKNPQERYTDSSREETAHRVAWSAVEKKYYKNSDDQWVEKQ